MNIKQFDYLIGLLKLAFIAFLFIVASAIVVGMLEAAERAQLEDRLRTHPGQFVAQYPVTPSLSPKWDGEALAPAAVG